MLLANTSTNVHKNSKIKEEFNYNSPMTEEETHIAGITGLASFLKVPHGSNTVRKKH